MRNEKEEDGDLVPNMVSRSFFRVREYCADVFEPRSQINVLLPLPSHIPFGSAPPLEGDRLKSFWYRTLVEKYHTVVPFFP